MSFRIVEGNLGMQGTVSGTDSTTVALTNPEEHTASNVLRIWLENPEDISLGGGSTVVVNALVGADGVTVTSGTSIDTISGFYAEFQAASGTLSSEIDSDIATHAADGSAHHSRYTDAEAITALEPTTSALAASGVATDANIVAVSGHLSSEIDSDISAHAAISTAHHSRYTDSEAITALEPTTSALAASGVATDANVTTNANDIAALLASGIADDANLISVSGHLSTEIDTDIATHAAISTAHHSRYTDAEAIAALEPTTSALAASGVATNTNLVSVSGHLQNEIDAIDSSVTLQDAYDNGTGLITTTAGKSVVVSGTGGLVVSGTDSGPLRVDSELVATTGTFTEGLSVGNGTTHINNHAIITTSGVFSELSASQSASFQGTTFGVTATNTSINSTSIDIDASSNIDITSSAFTTVASLLTTVTGSLGVIISSENAAGLLAETVEIAGFGSASIGAPDVSMNATGSFTASCPYTSQDFAGGTISVGDTDITQLGITAGSGTFSESLTISGEPVVTQDRFHYKNVKDYGAVGDGSTDDTTAIQNAIDNTLRTGTFVPAGTYVVTGLTIGSAGELILDSGAALKLKDNTAAHVITVNANDVVIRGPGTVDGNRANQVSDSNFGVLISGSHRLLVDGIYVTGVPAQGIYVQDSNNSIVRSCRVDNTGGTGIFGAATLSNLENFVVEDCLVDRSDDPANDGGGIKIHENLPNDTLVLYPLVTNCTVLMHSQPTGSNVVGIEYWGDLHYGRIDACTVSGSSIGISVANGSSNSAISNSTVLDANGIGIELVDCVSCTATANTVEGNNNSTSGIIVDGSGLTTSGNAVIGNTVRGATNQHIYVYSDAEYTSVVGNTVQATYSNAHGIYILESDQVSLVGNVLSGNDFGNSSVLVNNSSYINIQGSMLRGWNQGIQLVANAEAHDYINIDGNNISDLKTGNQILITEQSGGTYGDHVSVGRNPGYSFGSLDQTEVLRFKSDGNDSVFRGIHHTSPEGSITAEAGSFLQIYGTANPAALAFLKNSTSGNTGWKPIQVLDYGNTASRPAGLGAGETGFRYFDTDLDTPVWWNGSAYVNVGPGLVEHENGYFQLPTSGSYTLIQSAAYGFDIVNFTAQTNSGAISGTLLIDGVVVEGIDNQVWNDGESTSTATAANSVSAGGKITLAVSGTTDAEGFAWTYKTTRT